MTNAELVLATERLVACQVELQRAIDAGVPSSLATYGPGRHCVVCLRRFEVVPGRGGPLRIYCGPACRSRATDRRRRDLPREWRWCAACEGVFLALVTTSSLGGPGQVTCPPPWPASPYGRSDCARARRRETNRDAARLARARDR
jgi:hypothetical protein